MAIERFEDLDLTRRYTYADYLSWRFEERVELFKGWVARMAGPSTYHQRISTSLLQHLANTLRPFGCEVFAAPTDVVIARSPDGDTVVQPDLLVVCDVSKITKQYIDGAPDFIVEIVTPQRGPTASGAPHCVVGNGKKELDKKYKQYEAAGVREYWVVHPDDQTVLRYVLGEDGRFVGQEPRTVDSEEIGAAVFDNLVLSGAQIFP